MIRPPTVFAFAAIVAWLSGFAASALAQTPIINTWAGGGAPSGTIASSIVLNEPNSVALDLSGNTYIASAEAGIVYKVDAAGAVSVFAGGGTQVGTAADGGPATAALLRPSHLVWRNNELFLVSAPGVRSIDTTTGLISTVLGGGTQPFTNGMLAISLTSACVEGLAASAAGDLYTTDPCTHTIMRIDPLGRLTIVAGTRGTAGFSGDGSPAMSATLNTPFEVAVAANGNVVILDQRRTDDSGAIRARLIVAGANGVVDGALDETITSLTAGRSQGLSPDDGVPALLPYMSGLSAVGFDSSGMVIVAQQIEKLTPVAIWQIDAGGFLYRVAGAGGPTIPGPPSYGDGGPARSAQLGLIGGFAVTPTSIVLADREFGLVRRIEGSPAVITRVAGSVAGYSGDGGPATSAQMRRPSAIAFDPTTGNGFIVDQAEPVLRMVEASTGVIRTVTPIAPPSRFQPSAIAVHPSNGRVFFVNRGEHRIWALNPTTRGVTIVAGTGVRTCSVDCAGGNPSDDLGDGGLALDATFNGPTSLAFDAGANLYVADAGNHVVRRLDTVSGVISTVAGVFNSGIGGFNGDGGLSTATLLLSPRAVAVGPDGTLFIADTGNSLIRTIPGVGGGMASSAGTITTVVNQSVTRLAAGAIRLFYPVGNTVRVWEAGVSTSFVNSTGLPGFAGDDGPALDARLNGPSGLAVYGGALFIVDTLNDRVRVVGAPTTNQPPTANGQSVTTPFGTPVSITLSGVDPEGAPLTVAIVTNPLSGLLTSAGGSTYAYAPAAGFSGVDGFTFTVSDGTQSSAAATVSIVVQPNRAPTADPQSLRTGYGQPLTIALTGSDPEGDPLTFSVTALPGGGSLTPAGAATWVYQPNIGFSGADAFRFTAADPYGVSSPAQVQLVVGAPGETPAGTNVTVQPPDLVGTPQPVTLTFAQVTTSGITTAVPVSPPPPPANFQVNGLVYDITTTAVYVPPIRVCFTGTFSAADQILHHEAGAWVALPNQVRDPFSGPPFTRICADTMTLSPFVVGRPSQTSLPTITMAAPLGGATYVLNQPVTVGFTCTSAVAAITSCAGTRPNGAPLDTASVGEQSFTVTASDALGNTATQTVAYRVGFASTGTCFGEPGHRILFPIAANGSSVFPRALPVLARFRVCDASGRPVGSNVVTGFRLVESTIDGVTTARDEAVPGVLQQQVFRWDPLFRQWYFIIDTRRYVPGLYKFRVFLTDGSSVDFQFRERP